LLQHGSGAVGVGRHPLYAGPLRGIQAPSACSKAAQGQVAEQAKQRRHARRAGAGAPPRGAYVLTALLAPPRAMAYRLRAPHTMAHTAKVRSAAAE
jgi:hypothetical protein